MSIFDSLKKTVLDAVDDVKNVAESVTRDKEEETFEFAALPESLSEMQALPEAALDTPFKTAALTICAFCAYAAAPEIGTEMINFLKGPQPLSTSDIQFIRDRFSDKKYVPFSYFDSAKPENDYTPSAPFKVTFFTNPYSYANEGYVKLFVRSSGADTERQVILRSKGNQWFLWEYAGLLLSIKQSKSEDPWA